MSETDENGFGFYRKRSSYCSLFQFEIYSSISLFDEEAFCIVNESICQFEKYLNQRHLNEML